MSGSPSSTRAMQPPRPFMAATTSGRHRSSLKQLLRPHHRPGGDGTWPYRPSGTHRQDRAVGQGNAARPEPGPAARRACGNGLAHRAHRSDAGSRSGCPARDAKKAGDLDAVGLAHRAGGQTQHCPAVDATGELPGREVTWGGRTIWMARTADVDVFDVARAGGPIPEAMASKRRLLPTGQPPGGELWPAGISR